MAVKSTFTENNEVLVISITGAFDFSMLNDFREAYSTDVDKTTKVIVDMRDTTNINSSALGMLLNMQRYLNKDDGEIDIINCNQVVEKIFQITHFNKKFSIK